MADRSGHHAAPQDRCARRDCRLSVLAGCEGPQSALHTAGPDAAAYALLGNIMYAGATAIFIS
jgi:hypothetical protein